MSAGIHGPEVNMLQAPDWTQKQQGGWPKLVLQVLVGKSPTYRQVELTDDEALRLASRLIDGVRQRNRRDIS